MKVGVLALQGDSTEHRNALESLGVAVLGVTSPADLAGIDALVMPGGESTVIGMLMESSGLFESLKTALDGGLPVMGTCAGMILMAREIVDGRSDQRSLNCMDIEVRRNGYGRQVASFEMDLAVEGIDDGDFHAVFIRAPVVERVGSSVEVLARDAQGFPVMCRQGALLACSFHPELTEDRRIHAMFLSQLR